MSRTAVQQQCSLERQLQHKFQGDIAVNTCCCCVRHDFPSPWPRQGRAYGRDPALLAWVVSNNYPVHQRSIQAQTGATYQAQGAVCSQQAPAQQAVFCVWTSRLRFFRLARCDLLLYPGSDFRPSSLTVRTSTGEESYMGGFGRLSRSVSRLGSRSRASKFACWQECSCAKSERVHPPACYHVPNLVSNIINV